MGAKDAISVLFVAEHVEHGLFMKRTGWMFPGVFVNMRNVLLSMVFLIYMIFDPKC